MRMRRKNNLDVRIRASRDYLVAYEGVFRNVNDYIKDKDYIDFKTIFGNDNNVELDLGCGLGGFIIEKARQNPDINFIGVEKYSNVIIGAVEKAKELKINNLKFINCRIECIPKYIADDSISNIYLNFSNPLPNLTDAKKRLTSERFLDIYKHILKKDGLIIQKTDNRDFFDYSIESFKDNGFVLDNICYDLEKNPVAGNIQTEHEIKYIKDGRKIHRLEARNEK